MKRLVIRVLESSQKPYKVQIRPGTTSDDILTHLKLEHYVLSTSPTRPALPPCLDAEEDVYPHVRDGSRLYAIPFDIEKAREEFRRLAEVKDEEGSA